MKTILCIFLFRTFRSDVLVMGEGGRSGVAGNAVFLTILFCYFHVIIFFHHSKPELPLK